MTEPSVAFPHDNLYARLRVSPGKGIGVFAIRDIPPGCDPFRGEASGTARVPAAVVDAISDPDLRQMYLDFCPLVDGAYVARGAVHRVRLGKHGFFDPFAAVDRALDAASVRVELAHQVALAEAEANTRGPISRVVGALLGVGALFVTATIIVVGGEDIVEAVGNYLGIGAVGRAVWATVQFGLALGLLVATAFIIYYFLPCVPQRKSHVVAASLLATALGLIGTLGFRWYVQNFADYNATYGTIGGIIVLLTWMYWSMFAILAGGELASELRAGTGSHAIPNAGLSVPPGGVQTHQGFPHPSSEVA